MTLPEVVIWLVVATVGIPSAWRNPTAAALVIAWFGGQTYYAVTGHNIPVEYYLFGDIFVIAVIMAKREAYNLRPYRSTLHQLACILLERSPADRIVLLIFPAMWMLYVAEISAFAQWYALFSLAIIQFLAAGWEAFALYRRDTDAAHRLPVSPGDLRVAYPGGRCG